MTMTRRTALAASLAVLAAPALVRTAAAQGQPFTLLLDWFVNPNHGPIMAAQELGYFGEAGLDMKIIPPADPNDPPRLVAAGRGDVAVSYPHLQIRQAVDDIPTMRIGALIDTPLSTITALADGPVKTLADLRGRKIGYSISGVESALLKTMLGTVGVDIKDVELVNVNFSLSPALLARRVDAVIGAFRNFELFQLEIEGSKGRAFFLEEHGVPTHDALTFAVHGSLGVSGGGKLTTREEVRRYLRATYALANECGGRRTLWLAPTQPAPHAPPSSGGAFRCHRREHHPPPAPLPGGASSYPQHRAQPIQRLRVACRERAARRRPHCHPLRHRRHAHGLPIPGGHKRAYFQRAGWLETELPLSAGREMHEHGRGVRCLSPHGIAIALRGLRLRAPVARAAGVDIAGWRGRALRDVRIKVHRDPP